MSHYWVQGLGFGDSSLQLEVRLGCWEKLLMPCLKVEEVPAAGLVLQQQCDPHETQVQPAKQHIFAHHGVAPTNNLSVMASGAARCSAGLWIGFKGFHEWCTVSASDLRQLMQPDPDQTAWLL